MKTAIETGREWRENFFLICPWQGVHFTNNKYFDILHFLVFRGNAEGMLNWQVIYFGYNIFERITKEGRKYGLLLGIVSQRPSELSETTISQCSNFLVFKMFHPRDLQFIKDIISSADITLTNKIKTLHPGTCIMFGTAFKMPTIAILDKPNPEPLSQSCDINKTWYLNNN